MSTSAFSLNVRYFPPPGHLPLTGTDSRNPAPGSAVWFPLHLLLAELGRCCARDCRQPGAYILVEVGEQPGPMICLPVCQDHVCELARESNVGHARCPKCYAGWTFSPDLTPEFFAPVLPGGA